MKIMQLSPFLVTMLATSALLSVSNQASGKSVENASINQHQQKSVNVVVQTRSYNIPVVVKSESVSAFEIAQIPSTPSKASVTPSKPATPTSETPVTPSKPATPTSETPTTQIPGTAEPRVQVAEVLVTGVEGELQKTVYDAIRTKPGRTTTRTQLQQDVNAIYDTGYFALANVSPEDTPLGVRVTFSVRPNPVLTQIKVSAVPVLPGKQIISQKIVDEIFGKQYGKIINLRELQEGIKQLNKWYKDKGFDLAQVVETRAPEADGIVNLVVAEGVVEDIQVRFLNKDKQPIDDQNKPVKGRTRPFIIARELQLKSGDIFNRQVAQKDLQRVYGLGLFEDVQLSFSPGKDPRQVVVVVDVIERNSGSIAAGAGLSSSSGLFGTLSYQQQNLGGNNQKLGAEIQVGQRELLFDANFTDPWIAGDPHHTGYNVNGFRRRTISLVFDGGKNVVNLPNGDRPRVLRQGGGFTFTRPLTKNPLEKADWVASLGVQYQRVSIRNANGDLSPRDALGNNLSFSTTGKDDLTTVQLAVVRDKRNDALRPSKGSLIRFGIEQSIPLGEGNIFLNRLRGSYSYYLPVHFLRLSKDPHQSLAFNLQAGTVFGDLPPYEAFSMGGGTSVRGYAEGDVGAGRSFLQATAEYRFPLFKIVGGALFIDAASDLGTGNSVPGDPAAVRGKPGSGIGYGLGVRIQSPLGPIRVDYGFNDRGDSRIHFGIGERF